MASKATNSKQARSGRSARAMEEKIAHAVNHPVRLDALSILFERVASPKEIGNLLGVPLGTVSFHIVELAKEGVIELVRTEPRRGAVEHYYRAKMRPEISDEEWKGMPRTARRDIAALAIQAIVAEGLASLRHGMMDADDCLHLTWMPMRLDAEGRTEVADLQAEMLDRFEAIKAQNAARIPEDDGAPVRVVVMMGFDRGTRQPAGRRRQPQRA